MSAVMVEAHAFSLCETRLLNPVLGFGPGSKTA